MNYPHQICTKEKIGENAAVLGLKYMWRLDVLIKVFVTFFFQGAGFLHQT